MKRPIPIRDNPANPNNRKLDITSFTRKYPSMPNEGSIPKAKNFSFMLYYHYWIFHIVFS